MSPISQKDSVKKNVSCVHITNSLTLLQRKAFNVLLLNAYDQLLAPNVMHEVDLDLFCSVLGYNSTNYPYLKNSLKELMTTVIEGDIFDESGNKEAWRAFTLLSSVEMDYKKRSITYEFSTRLAKQLYNPDVFASFNLSIQGAFNSKYALALYENCSRYRGIGATGEIELEVLKRLLGVFSKSYDKYKLFNDKILKPSIKEINQISDITITDVITIKEGRSIKRLKFLFKSKAQKNLLNSQANKESIESSKVYLELISLGMDKQWSLLTCASHDEKYISDKIAYADRENEKGKVSNYKGFLYNAIKGDWVDESHTKLEVTKAKKAKAAEVKAKAAKAKKESDNKLQDKSQFEQQAIADYLTEQNELDLTILKAEFESTLSITEVPRKMRDYDRPMFRATFHRYVLANKLGAIVS